MEGFAELHIFSVEIRELEKGGVLYESLSHRELISEFVVALDRITVRTLARDGCGDSWAGDVLEYTDPLPVRVTGP